jgi:hypothetical protein
MQTSQGTQQALGDEPAEQAATTVTTAAPSARSRTASMAEKALRTG